MKRKHTFLFLCALLTSIASLFLIIMHFRHEPHWPPDRFGGTPGALVCIPICLVSYAITCWYANRWLHPVLFPRLRAIIPGPSQEPPTNRRKRALTILISFFTGTVSGAIVILHFFHQPQWPQDRFGGTPGAVACIPICLASYSLCFYYVDQWLRPILFPRLRTAIFPQPPDNAPTDPRSRPGRQL